MYRATPPHRLLLTNRFHVVLATRRLVPPSPTGICRRVKVSAALRCFRTLCFKQHLSRFIVVYGYKLFSFATNDVKSGVVTLKLNDDDGRVVRVTTKYRHHCTMYLISSLRGQTDRHFQLKLIISERPNFAVAFDGAVAAILEINQNHLAPALFISRELATTPTFLTQPRDAVKC